MIGGKGPEVVLVLGLRSGGQRDVCVWVLLISADGALSA